MAKFRAPYLFTETRLNLDQAYAGSTVDITLSRTGNHERRQFNDVQIGSDEEKFARDHIASDASLYFRSDDRYPRSFLWRLLDERRGLEIQSVDLSQDSGQKVEAILTLLLRFPAAIRPFCIAFAESTERDAVHVFAITTANELWTLTLQRDLFVHPKNSESLMSDWCKVTKPSIFAVTTPYRLFSSTSRELFVSVADGQVVRLTRRAGEDGSRWHDAVYSEGRWGTSFLKWRSGPSIRFADLDLDPSAAVSLASTSFDDDDAHLITVCLNHTLRIWNLKTGRISAELDILGEEEQKYLIAATQKQSLQLVDMPARQEFYVVTYSPKHHQFKFWAIFDAEAGRQGIREMRPEIEYKPPIETLMDTAVWNLEEFQLRPSRGSKQTELWIRVRSGQASQVFMLSFDPFDFGHKLHEVSSQYVKECWEQDWVAVFPGRQTLDCLDALSPAGKLEFPSASGSSMTSDRWLDFLLYPERFTTSLLETALHTLTNLPGLASTSTKASLRDRLTDAIRSSAAGNGDKKKSTDIAAAWQSYYGIVRDLYKRSVDTVSFVLDPHDQIPWLVTTNCVAPIRECSQLEKMAANADVVHALPSPRLALYNLDQADNESQSEAIETADEPLGGNLFLAAHTLRSFLPTSFQEHLKQQISKDLTDDSSKSVADRMQRIQGDSPLADQLSEEDNVRFDELVTDLGGYQLFHTDNFLELLKTLTEPERGRHQEEQITRYGSKLVVRIAQETVALNLEVLLDLLAVVLYLDGSFEVEELAAAIQGIPEDTVDTMEVDGASPVFDAYLLFDKTMNLLRENILLDFLISHLRRERAKSRRKSVTSPLARAGSEPVYSSTLLQSIFIGDWPEVKAPEEGISAAGMLTYITRAWLTKLDAGQYENFSAHVFADLVKHGDVDLASQFLPFVPLSGWSSYLRGRLSLEKGQYDDTADWFKKAAFAMSLGFFDVGNHDTAEILRPDQVDKFSDGLPSYYEHIMELLLQVKANSHVSDFAKLALQAHNMAIDKAHKDAESHGKELSAKQSSDFAKRTTELLSRLFNSSLQIGHFDDAYMALTRMPDQFLRHSCVQSFIQTLVSQYRVKQLFAYPWTQLAEEADKELERKAKNTLNTSSKPEYFKILYSWRIKRGNFRGAAQAAFDRLEKLRGEMKGRGSDPQDERLVEAYLLLINAMACIGKDEAWVIREPIAEKKGLINGTTKEKKEGKRCLVTLEDVRREYQEELDKLAALEQGRFAFTGGNEGDEMDVL